MGWGIPVSPVTVMVTAGSIGLRPRMDNGALVDREVLCVTLSFDHTVVDGGPAARFATTLRQVIEGATAL
jgi:pyruvate/2-oxoglutarate dehydrogenase complex dihydrolipoamide acyltransferase (E2) component